MTVVMRLYESSTKRRLEDKVWKVGDMAMKIIGLVVYTVAWAKAYLRIAVWLQQTWAENWGLCPFFRGGERSWVSI